MISVTIPGEPVAQGRPRFCRAGNGVRAVDPTKSRNWKATARAHMQMACEKPLGGPVSLEVRAFFTCPKSDYRKRNPRGLRYHTKRPDLDNVVKAVKDAGTGVLWLDDSQIARLMALKFIAVQGEPPMVEVVVERCTVDCRGGGEGGER